jgi:hypothetical protein
MSNPGGPSFGSAITQAVQALAQSGGGGCCVLLLVLVGGGAGVIYFVHALLA